MYEAAELSKYLNDLTKLYLFISQEPYLGVVFFMYYVELPETCRHCNIDMVSGVLNG